MQNRRKRALAHAPFRILWRSTVVLEASSHAVALMSSDGSRRCIDCQSILFYLSNCFLTAVLNMDRASQVLAQGVPVTVPRSHRALADHGGVPRSTLHYRAHGRRSIEEKAQRQQYLSPSEDEAVVNFLLQMSHLGQPVRMKHIPAIAFCATRQRPQSERPPRPPGRN